MKVLCPICDNKSGNYKYKVDDYSIYKCNNCGLEHTFPIPSQQLIIDFYNTYVDERADYSIVKRNAQNNLKHLERYEFNKDSKVLDFGCGEGKFVDIAGENCYGIEIGNHKHKRIFNKFEDLPIKKFDFITLWGVLEHITDIKNIMKNIMKYLKKDGHIIITTVNAEGDIPYYYKPPEHLTYWTKDSLNILAKYLDCEVIEVVPYQMQQFSNIYLKRLLSRTPKEYSDIIINANLELPEIVTVPTNELFTVFKKGI